MSAEALWQVVGSQGVELALKVLAAIAAWLLGRWLIAVVLRMAGSAFEYGSRLDTTLTTYLRSILGFMLNVLLILAIMDMFGVKTTSFAALLAGAGLAIGTAWGGLLTHFAAGVFMQVLRPFKVGDFIQGGGVSGKVKEIGLFGTTLVSPDAVHTIIGNNALFSGAIQNFSMPPRRPVDCEAKLGKGRDTGAAIDRIRVAITGIPNVLDKPPLEIEILDARAEGTVLAVRPYCLAAHYVQVLMDARAAIDRIVEDGDLHGDESHAGEPTHDS